jgi:hypothetical protein
VVRSTNPLANTNKKIAAKLLKNVSLSEYSKRNQCKFKMDNNLQLS